MTRHQYEISGLVPQASFRGETSDCVAKWRLCYQANVLHNLSPEKNWPKFSWVRSFHLLMYYV